MRDYRHGLWPRIAEIRGAIASVLHQPPRWLINTHWHFDHTDGNPTFAEDGTTIVVHATAGRACPKTNMSHRSNGEFRPRNALHGRC
jgi:glyoxylase-like metal-dependent hydrolase (beta-lactamase superfamily II)